MPELTKREADILRASIRLGDARSVADEMGLAISTVRNARHAAYKKLGVSGSTALLKAAQLVGAIR